MGYYRNYSCYSFFFFSVRNEKITARFPLLFLLYIILIYISFIKKRGLYVGKNCIRVDSVVVFCGSGNLPSSHLNVQNLSSSRLLNLLHLHK